MSDIRLVYKRPPDRTDVFEQLLLTVEDGCHVTLLEPVRLKQPMRIGDAVVLEDGASVVWFTFEGAWHDVGRFHNAAGEFTGYYANAIIPVTFHDATNWECTDLFLDVWLAPNGSVTLLDEDELDSALSAGWIAHDVAARARIETEQIRAGALAGSWPPRIARTWTLEHARANK